MPERGVALRTRPNFLLVSPTAPPLTVNALWHVYWWIGSSPGLLLIFVLAVVLRVLIQCVQYQLSFVRCARQYLL